MRAVFLLLIFIGSSAEAGLFGQSCPKHGRFFTQASLEKHSQVHYVETDTRGFCHRNMLLRYLNATTDEAANSGRENPFALSTRELERRVDSRSRNDRSIGGPWEMILLSTPTSRERALASMRENFDPGVFDFSRPRPMSLRERSVVHANVLRISRSEPVRHHLDSMVTLGKIVGCSEEDVRNAGECKRGLDLLESRLTPRRGSTASIARVDLYARVLGNPRYDEGLRRAALEISGRLTNPRVPGNIFDDLKKSFVGSGLNDSQATQAAWETLGLIATGGANLQNRMMTVLNPSGASFSVGSTTTMPQNAAALNFIGVAMGLLDSKRDRIGLPLYSYPNGVQTSCDNAKPYHFWLAAFNARELVVQDRLSPTAAKMASFASQKAYQVSRSALSRQNAGTRAFGGMLSMDSYSPAAQVVRTDLAYAAAGAEFGIRSAGTTARGPVNVDRVLLRLVESSTAIPPMPAWQETLTPLPFLYQRWKTVYAPNEAYRSSQQGR